MTGRNAVLLEVNSMVYGENLTSTYKTLIKKITSSKDPAKEAVGQLHMGFDHFNWVGIYVVCGGVLKLGPFKGSPTPHTTISIEKGICGAAVRKKRTINLPDVHADPRHIACSTTTRSELVVPIWHQDKVVAEIDIDSNDPSAFCKIDEQMMNEIAKFLSPYIDAIREQLES